MTSNKALPSGTAALFIIFLALVILGVILLSPNKKPVPGEVIPLLQRTAVPIRPFTLTNQHQALVTEKQLKGQWTLLYFGYVKCLDTCPATLSILSTIHSDMTTNRRVYPDPQFWLVTLDPDHDTPQQLDDYLKPYDPAINGLTGFRSEIQKLAAQLGLNPDVLSKSTDSGFLDHDEVIFLIDPQARMVALFRQPLDATTIGRQLNQIQALFSPLSD